MPYEIKVEDHFAAAHALRGYGGACERRHGHNFKVTAVVTAAALDEVGMSLDFKEVARFLREVLETLDHQDLNELAAFRNTNATAENIATYIYSELAPRFKSPEVRIARISVEESPKYAASYLPPD
ncbi:MAG: 6-carboxytetrahydropterin synthase [Candidatus Coatesbacteria bacterium]|nr:MAG: 6-carboxytetrahydropterin synthase [Candidatus Coatesbacteria bacterium]